MATFVRDLPSVDNLESVGAKVFNSTSDGRVNRFKQAVHYFSNGTRTEYGRHKEATLRKSHQLTLTFSLFQFILSFFHYLVRQHNHHNESKGHKHGHSNAESKARKLASEAADEEV